MFSFLTTMSEANLIRYHVSDNKDGSDCDSEHDLESDVELGVPLKDIKGAGRTIACCCDMFCDVNKALHLVMLSKQEEQGENDFEDEDGRCARKKALDCM